MYIPTREELQKILDKPLFHKISETADELGMECYIVGGYVRDIFLQRPSTDLDVVVVGKGIEKTLESHFDSKEIKSVNLEENQP